MTRRNYTRVQSIATGENTFCVNVYFKDGSNIVLRDIDSVDLNVGAGTLRLYRVYMYDYETESVHESRANMVVSEFMASNIAGYAIHDKTPKAFKE